MMNASDLLLALAVTLGMTLIGTILAYVIGFPIGVVLNVTSKTGIKPNKVVNSILGTFVNIMRSIPCLLLIVILLPLTRLLLGRSTGEWYVMIIPIFVAAFGFVKVMGVPLEKYLASVIKRVTGKDILNIPGAGAAGGIGGALASFLDATLKRGAGMVLDAVGFDDVLSCADIVFTGEGCLDGQTLTGKLPYCVAQRSAKAGVPVAAVCGRAEVDECQYLDAIVPVTPDSLPLSEAMMPYTASENIKKAVASYIHDRLHL